MPDVSASNFPPPGARSPGSSPSPSGIRIAPLPAPISRARLTFTHLLGLLPAVAILGAVVYAAISATRNVCNLRLLYPDAPGSVCLPLMDVPVVLFFALGGALCWYAAYAMRPVVWDVTHYIAHFIAGLFRCIVCINPMVDENATATTGVFTALLRSVVDEALRLMGLELCVIVVIALAWKEQHERLIDPPARLLEACWVAIDDPRFPIALWLGAGWGMAEVVAGTCQLGKFLPMFRILESPSPRLGEGDLLGDYVYQEDEDEEEHLSTNNQGSGDEEELDLDELILIREKTELEEQLGELLENVSPVTIALWRIDSVLWNVGSTLVLASSMTYAQGCSSDTSPIGQAKPYAFLPFPSLRSMQATLLALVAIHTVAATIWMLALPHLRLLSVTYTSMLIGLALLSAGLGLWGALL